MKPILILILAALSAGPLHATPPATFSAAMTAAAAIEQRDTDQRLAAFALAAPLATTDPQRGELLFEQGKTNDAGRRFTEAIAAYRAALPLITGRERHHVVFYLVRTLVADGQGDEACVVANQECIDHPDDAASYNAWAFVLEKMRRWADAAVQRQATFIHCASTDVARWDQIPGLAADLRRAGRTPREVNAVLIPLLTAHSVESNARFASAVECVDRGAMTTAELRDFFGALLRVTAAATGSYDAAFRGTVSALLQTLPAQ